MAKADQCSDIMMVPQERVMAMQMSQAAREMPNIDNMSVVNSKVHVGPKFVSVTQNVQNNEMVKGHLLGLELVSIETSRRVRCSVAVFLCWAFLVSSGFAFYLFFLAMHKQQDRLDLGLNEEWYVRREEWLALKKYEEVFLELPVQYVLIGHSAGSACPDRYRCIKSVLGIQEGHLQRGFDDIGPNFLVGGPGYVFEGRGANLVGAMVKSWNSKSITIMFVGDYRTDDIQPGQIEHVKILLEKLLEKQILAPDYILFGNCQVSPYIISPGPNVMHRLNQFSHWNSTNESTCLG